MVDGAQRHVTSWTRPSLMSMVAHVEAETQKLDLGALGEMVE